MDAVSRPTSTGPGDSVKVESLCSPRDEKNEHKTQSLLLFSWYTI